MNWNTCFSDESLFYTSPKKDARSNFQKDYDRIIFSSSFRRLQNKTQVFPLPGTVFVHNRLTHSLEVASVGRSLGEIVGNSIIEKDRASLDAIAIGFYSRDLSSVITSACLAHDIGNPAFGHSGEEAISNFFRSHEHLDIEGESLISKFSKKEWSDLVSFEGNANALRVLTQEFQGKSPSGLGITLTTLASILKYPCASFEKDKNLKHRKKYGYFQSEYKSFHELVNRLGLYSEEDGSEAYKRHPFVYLVEAADDICYSIIDMEDAHRIGILSKDKVSGIFLNLIQKLNQSEIDVDKTYRTFKRIGDDNESVAYLRAKCISALVAAAADEFLDQRKNILEGNYNSSLIDEIETRTGAMKDLNEISLNEIYRHQSVLEIEVAGFHVMSELLQLFIPAVLKNTRNHLDKTILRLIPYQFQKDVNSESPYLRVMNVLDHISGMTDAYATEMFRKLKGIEISRMI